MTEREMARKKAAARKERARKARNRRVVTTVALMMVVCIASIGGTIAWLTDSTEAVVNAFSPSGIDVSLNETNPSADKRTNIQIVPGVDITKDPKVSAESDVAYYVFVKVTEENWPDWKETDNTTLKVAYSVDTSDGKWIKLSAGEGETINGITANDTVYYRAMNANAKLESASILTNDVVTVSENVTKEELATLKEAKPKLSFMAYAIQQQNGNKVTNADGAVTDDGLFTPLEAWNTLNPVSGT